MKMKVSKIPDNLFLSNFQGHSIAVECNVRIKATDVRIVWNWVFHIVKSAFSAIL